MSLHVCLKCTTSYAVGLKACPQCGETTRNAVYSWEADVVKGNTYYLPEGAEVPPELGPDVRLVGPGAPKPKAEAKAEAKAEPPKGEVKDEKPKAAAKK